MTKRYRIVFWVMAIFHFLLNIAPMAVYGVKALIESDLIVEKVTLSMTAMIVLILTCISLVNKVALRSRIWILLIGLYICLDYIMIPLIVIAVCQTVDELIVHPISKHYGTKLTISKEMDKRI